MRRRHHVTAVAVLVLLGLVWSVQADDQLKNHPGYFPVEDLELFASEDLIIDINISGAMLKIIASIEKDEPEIAELISGLKRIRARIGSLQEDNKEAVRAAIERSVAQLEKRGWQAILRVRQESQEISFLMAERDGEIQGLTLFVITEEHEVAMINIVGSIDPQAIGELPMLEDIDLGDLGDLGKKPPAEDKDDEDKETNKDTKNEEKESRS